MLASLVPRILDIAPAVVAVGVSLLAVLCIYFAYDSARKFLLANGNFKNAAGELWKSYKEVRFNERMKKEYYRQKRFEKSFVGKMRTSYRSRGGKGW